MQTSYVPLAMYQQVVNTLRERAGKIPAQGGKTRRRSRRRERKKKKKKKTGNNPAQIDAEIGNVFGVHSIKILINVCTEQGPYA